MVTDIVASIILHGLVFFASLHVIPDVFLVYKREG